ncbi:MAG TPA: aspartate kinase [Candidatus Paceibacterota bacterium]|nr:aspartate kinase [Candidatus Paceibacterota bacterium]
MARKIIINKFGGGILTKKFIPLIKERLNEQIKAGYMPVIVVSAMHGITDEIIKFLNNKKISDQSIRVFIKNLRDMHDQIMANMGVKVNLQEIFSKLRTVLEEALLRTVLAPADEDEIVSYGEKLSAAILTSYLSDLKLPVKKYLAEEIPIITDDNFKNANILYKESEKNVQNKFLNLKEIPIIPGFTGITRDGQTTTLGRGGTDTTACFIGSALQARNIILWKDVAGVFSADPKIVPKARTIPYISYREAEESGKVIHEKAIQYVKMFKTPIEITYIANPKLKTKIGKIMDQQKGAKIVSFKKDLALIIITDETAKITELLYETSRIFSKYKVDMILISNTRYSLQIVADNNNGLLDKVIGELKGNFSKIEISKVNMFFLVGNFNVKDVNDFNDILIKHKTGLQISAFLYENCTRLEAVVKSDKVEDIIRVLYKKFIK